MSGSLLSQAGQFVFQLAFQVSPIILNNGIAAKIPGGMLPIVVLTEAIGLVNGLISGSGFPTSMDDAFCQFMPLPGATLINNQIGMYPFANQQVAANAIIQQPLNISLMMIAPVRDAGGFVAKIATFTALQAALSQHNATGGTYTICTPSFIYTNCVMTTMQDATSGDSKQQQIMWQMDFIKPLLTQQSATSVMNSLMSSISSGVSSAVSSVTGAASSILGTNVSSFVSAAPIPVTATPL